MTGEEVRKVWVNRGRGSKRSEWNECRGCDRRGSRRNEGRGS